MDSDADATYSDLDPSAAFCSSTLHSTGARTDVD